MNRMIASQASRVLHRQQQQDGGSRNPIHNNRYKSILLPLLLLALVVLNAMQFGGEIRAVSPKETTAGTPSRTTNQQEDRHEEEQLVHHGGDTDYVAISASERTNNATATTASSLNTSTNAKNTNNATSSSWKQPNKLSTDNNNNNNSSSIKNNDTTLMDDMDCSSTPINGTYCQAVRQTTMYSTCCQNVPDDEDESSKIYPLLITATPRSGTVFMSRFLEHFQIELADDAHEVQSHGMVSWVHIFQPPYDVKWVSADIRSSKFRSVWHQVRDPLKCLTSIAFTEPLRRGDYVAYLKRHISLQSSGTIEAQALAKHKANGNTTTTEMDKRSYYWIHRAMEFYIQWHEFINALRVPFFRLEDFVGEKKNLTVLDEIFTSIGETPPNHDQVLQLFADDQKEQQRRRRLALKAANGRKHRETLHWNELCHVNVDLTKQLLKMVQEWGYYTEKKLATVCQE